jgi:hypothetical protein
VRPAVGEREQIDRRSVCAERLPRLRTLGAEHDRLAARGAHAVRERLAAQMGVEQRRGDAAFARPIHTAT